jgi:hypothetical protein
MHPKRANKQNINITRTIIEAIMSNIGPGTSLIFISRCIILLQVLLSGMQNGLRKYIVFVTRNVK